MIVAWLMGNNDLKEMDAGTMDPAGRSNTKAGQICGIVGTILFMIALIIAVLFLVFGLAAFAAFQKTS